MIHNISLWAFGGAKGARDYGAFESAIARPQVGYYDNFSEEAAALLESLVMNHPFIDGNKRTGWFCFDVYLRLYKNHIRKELTNNRIYEWFVGSIEIGMFNIKYIKNWLKLSRGQL